MTSPFRYDFLYMRLTIAEMPLKSAGFVHLICGLVTKQMNAVECASAASIAELITVSSKSEQMSKWPSTLRVDFIVVPPNVPLPITTCLSSHSFQSHKAFLDATTHLYKRSCPSVRPSVGPSVRPQLFSNDEYGQF